VPAPSRLESARGTLPVMPGADPVLEQILARFRGFAVAESRGGDTLYDERSGHPVARLKPIPQSDHFGLFYWSSARERWRTFGDFGRLALTREEAHGIVTNEAIFCIPSRR
jgi:hypothetical protein